MILEDRIVKIKDVLINKNAEDVSDFDTRDSEYFVDSVVIASSRGDRHTNALLEHLKEFLPHEELLRVDSSNSWIVVDFGDILVHLMSKESRDKYSLESFLHKYQEK